MAKVLVESKKEVDISVSDDQKLLLNGEPYEFDYADLGNGHYHLIRGNKTFRIEVLSVNLAKKHVTLSINGKKADLLVKDKMDLLLEKLGMSSEVSRKINELKAPMPGLILEIKVEEGMEVNAGDPLLILEAMKMENVLKSAGAGIVKKISVTKGSSVEKNQVLIIFAQDTA